MNANSMQQAAKQGMVALERKQYSKAIALLTPLVEKVTQPSVQIRLQQALAKAHMGQGNPTQALVYCQQLQQNDDVAVQKWANSAIAHIEKSNSKRQTTDNTIHHLSSNTRPLPAPSVSPSPPRIPTLQSLPWTNADRAQKWSAIRPKTTTTTQLNTIFVHGWTAIALWGVATLFLNTGMAMGDPVRNIVQRMVSFRRWYFLELYPGRVVVMILLGLLILSPFLLDIFIHLGYRPRSLSLKDLRRYSPEAQTILEQSSRTHNHPIPTLQLLTIQTPLIFSYGLRPRWSRIVVSEGLLHQLNNDEIAVLYGAELSHVRHWNLGLMTLVVASTQISYSFYQWFSTWADRRKNSFLQWMGAAIAAIAYGLFWFVRWPGLWLSRRRLDYSDRMATNLTGNPNGLSRALLKIAIATATDIRRQGQTIPLLEQFEMLMPVGYRSALTIGSTFPVQWQAQFEQAEHGRQVKQRSHDSLYRSTILDWDYRNSHRNLLSINNTHPPLGDRLYRLTQYARRWKLVPELHLLASNPSNPSKFSPSPPLQLQIAPFLGLLVGGAIAVMLWTVGLISNPLQWNALRWLEFDSDSIFWGMLAIGFSCGTIVRINHFFPDIKPFIPNKNQNKNRNKGKKEDHKENELTDLSTLLTESNSLPVAPQIIRLEGKLIGRQGTNNWLNQDLLLYTQTGLIRLHNTSILGNIGHLIFDTLRLQSLKGQTVILTGWLRRGATPWIDINTIQPQRGQPIQCGHPIWSTVLACLAAFWGAYSIYQIN